MDELESLRADNERLLIRLREQQDRISSLREQLGTRAQVQLTDPLAMLNAHEVFGTLDDLRVAVDRGDLRRVNQRFDELAILLDSTMAGNSDRVFRFGRSYPIEEFDLGAGLDRGPLLNRRHYPDLQVSHDAKGVMVRTCRLALMQAVRTLWSNSVRASDGNGTVELLYDQATKILTFRDDGPGVPDPRLLFCPQVKPLLLVRGPVEMQHGFGLLTARAAVRMTGGDLWHVPTARGATFAIRLGAHNLDEQIESAR